MGWAEKYWDAVDEFYWTPSMLGLASIPKAERLYGDGTIAIPSERVSNSGSIYTRKGTAAKNAERMRRLEAPLNHICDITFGIAPDEAIETLFHTPMAIKDSGPFLRLGREIATRYPGFANNTTTQQDGFYVGPQSLVGVELKINSNTSPEQALKYLALMVAEEVLSGRRDQLGLLYITPSQSGDKIFAQIGADSLGRLPSDFVENVAKSRINKALKIMIERDRAHFDNAAARLQIAHVSWQQVAAGARAIASAQNNKTAAGQTYSNLMDGFADAILAQSGCC